MDSVSLKLSLAQQSFVKTISSFGNTNEHFQQLGRLLYEVAWRHVHALRIFSWMINSQTEMLPEMIHLRFCMGEPGLHVNYRY